MGNSELLCDLFSFNITPQSYFLFNIKKYTHQGLVDARAFYLWFRYASSGNSAPRWGAIEVPIGMRGGEEMKVMLVMKWETYKDEAKRKKYYEFDNSIWEQKHEGIKYKELGGWGVQPGKIVYLYEYESMEEFSKIWSDMEI
jgi:hypothetical protein